jgi:tetratricopeptide (TPR) repeat protein
MIEVSLSDRARELHQAGDAHRSAGQFAEALAAYSAAIDLNPQSPFLHYNAGNMLRLLGRPGEALARYDEAVALAPELAIAQHNRALCFLEMGDLAAGFRAYEWRKSCPTFDDPRYGLPRQWAGEAIAGKTLFIYPELYQGDLLQFGRFALLAERAGAHVLLGAPGPMHALLRTMSATIELLAEDATPAAYDYASALMSLPAAFRTTQQTVPRGIYLQADRERVARWRARIGAHGVKVGIAWQGSARAMDRSFPLAAAADLARIPGVRLISLQKHAGLEQLASLPAGMTVETLGEEFDPGPNAFVDTAAAMQACDLLIVPDTSVVHLAGALGLPTWLALNTPGDWRWLQGRADTPWYPTVRLFRQPSRGDWAGVFEAMAQALFASRKAQA